MLGFAARARNLQQVQAYNPCLPSVLPVLRHGGPMPKKSVRTEAGASLPNAAALSEEEGSKRVQVSQADIPAYSLEEALRVPRAIGIT
jgi:hypothetical protein